MIIYCAGQRILKLWMDLRLSVLFVYCCIAVCRGRCNVFLVGLELTALITDINILS
jgi:hypothetical protein